MTILKICRGCDLEKQEEDFPARNDRSGRRRPYCSECVNKINKSRYNRYKKESPFKLKASRARQRAAAQGLPFDLDEEYLESLWTGICPVFDQPIVIYDSDRSDPWAAELDKFIPELGYVKGNVNFLSRKANRLKNNMVFEELIKLMEWMKKYESDQG